MLQVRSAPLLFVAYQHLHISMVTPASCCAKWATATCCHLTLTASDSNFHPVLSAAAAAAAATTPMQQSNKGQAAGPQQKLFH